MASTATHRALRSSSHAHAVAACSRKTSRRRLCVAAASRQAAAAAAAPASADPTRRSTLLLALQAASAALLAQPAAPAAAEPAVLTVGAGQQFASIGEALASAPAGATVEVQSGRYTERLVVARPVTIAAAPDADVEVTWTTREPYQSVVEVDSALGQGLEAAGAVRLRGLRLRHSSPSVANNYAVRLVGCGAVLEGCDISSSTGCGVGIEGGSPTLLRCTVHDCPRHGVAVFGDLLERACGASLRGCALTRNALSGLLVRDGAAPAVADCTLTGNGEWGLSLLDAAGSYEGCEIGANARGSVAAWLPEEGVDTARLLAANRLDRPLQWVGPA